MTEQKPVVTEHVPMTHYLCSVTAQGEEADPQAFALGMANTLAGLGVVPLTSTAYMSKYDHSPVDLGLKDMWLRISRNRLEREDFIHAWPELARSIDLICGVTKRDLENSNEAASDSPV